VNSGLGEISGLAGCERKPFSDYLFGGIDVPALGADTSSIPAFDMSRSMKLNRQNEVVAEIIQFIGVNVEGVRRELEREDRERRKTDEQKRFQREGSKIAELINSHFKEWSEKLKNTLAKAGVGKDLLPEKDREKVDDMNVVFGDELPAVIIGDERGEQPVDPPGPDPIPRPLLPRVALDDDVPEKLAKPGASASRKRRGGGFEVTFDKIGVNEKRAKYDRETRTIIINLEHPRINLEVERAAGKSVTDDPNFLRMAYEIAFTEYAIVLAQELSTEQFYFDTQDALVELRQTIDDLSKAFARAWS